MKKTHREKKKRGIAMEVEQWEKQQAAYQTADGFTDKSVKGMWFTFEGRLNRMRYFLRVLPVYLLMGAVYAITHHVMWLAVLYVPILWSLLSLVARRAHDLGREPPLFWIAVCLPVAAGVAGLHLHVGLGSAACMAVGAVSGLYLLFKHGTHGANRYGLDPTEYPYDI